MIIVGICKQVLLGLQFIFIEELELKSTIIEMNSSIR